jgi:putative copper export protein
MNTIFLSARVLHIVCAALWFGAIVFVSMFLMPVLQQSGPEAGKIMVGMERRGLVIFMSSIAGITILSGFYLYWHLTGGFEHSMMGTPEVRVFGTGGILGLTAFIIGASVVGQSAKKVTALGAKMAGMAEKDRAAAATEMQRLRQKMVTYGHLVMALMAITIVLMSIGHYV